MRRLARSAWHLGISLCLGSLANCSQPALLRAPLAEPAMPPTSQVPMPAIAEPEGPPTIERDLTMPADEGGKS